MRWFLVLVPFFLFSQSPHKATISVIPKWGEQDFQLHKNYILEDRSVSFETLKFYISATEQIEDKKKAKPTSIFYLFDLENESAKSITLKNSTRKITFCIGVDSATHEKGALTGDLDPTKGMYWTWQTGYINLKVEGKENDTPFQYHIGGYLSPYNTFEAFTFEVADKDQYKVEIDFKKWFQKAKTLKATHIMSPGENAKTLAEFLQKCVSIK